MARQLNVIVDTLKVQIVAARQAGKASEAHANAEKAWKYAEFAVVYLREIAPDAAAQLAKKFPSLALDVAKNLTVKTGISVASPIVTFGHNMRVLGHTSDALRGLDAAVDGQLEGVDRLHERMKTLVARLK